MKTHTYLKHRLLVAMVGIGALVFAGLVVLPTLAQAAGGFDNSDLAGAYAGGHIGHTATAASPPNAPFAGTVRIVADGVSHLTLQAERNNNGALTTIGPLDCNYSIAPSGFGSITCTNGGTIHILLSDGGKQFDLFFVGNNVGGGHMIQQ
jgi:hypothetical protein